MIDLDHFKRINDTFGHPIGGEVLKLGFPAIQELSINVSIGMASFAKGESSAKLIERADKALYLAKANGRNRVRAAPLS